MFLGGVMVATGNQPPGTFPPRARNLANDLMRSSALYEVKMLDSPSNLLTDAARKIITVQRILTGRLIDGASEEEMHALVTSFFKAIFEDPQYRDASNDLILSDSNIEKIMLGAGMSKVNAEKALKRATAPEVKQKLQETTTEAVERGAYGSPTLFIHGGKQPFYDGVNPWMVFGSDRFEQIAFVCGLPYLGAAPKVTKNKL